MIYLFMKKSAKPRKRVARILILQQVVRCDALHIIKVLIFAAHTPDKGIVLCADSAVN